MDDKGQMLPLNLCNDIKPIPGGFFPLGLVPHQPAPVPVNPPSDFDLQLLQRMQNGAGGGSLLLPDYRLHNKVTEEEPKPNFSYIGEYACML